MPIIEITFPAGRFHATPWGRHVNEGAVEWPPAPWRLLRALVATWFLKSRTEVPDKLMLSLVHALAGEAPTFQLPPATLGHTRHYLTLIEGKNQKTAKVFDTFIHASGPLLVNWQTSLDADQQRALKVLCERLGYLGRAESLASVRVLADDQPFESNSHPLAVDDAVSENKELVRLLAPQPQAIYESWLRAQAPSASSKKSAKAKKPTGSELPASIFEALGADTGDLQNAGWTWPPGSQLVDYVRPENCFDLAPLRRRQEKMNPTVARFAVASAVLPRLTKALSVAERIHQALVKYSDQADVFTGTKDRIPLEGHLHAHIFCEANGTRSALNKAAPPDAITHVTVYAPMGMNAQARKACEVLTRAGVWGHGGHDLQLVLLGFGDAGTFGDCNLFQPSKIWRSLTPFVSTRHPKTFRDGRPKIDADGWPVGSPTHELRRLLLQEGHATPIKIEEQREIAMGGRRIHALDFLTQRTTGSGRHGHQPPLSFKLTFAEPVSGPLALGYGSHFSLGLFVPVDSL